MKKKNEHCTDVLKHICDNLDEQLSSAKCREIKRHLTKCPNCSTYLDSMKKTVRLYRQYPDLDVPSKARKRLYAVLKLKD